MPFVAAIVPERRPRRRRGRGRPAARPARPTYRRRRPAASDVRLDVVTIFPDYLAPLRLSLIGRAVDDGLLDLRVHDLRDLDRPTGTAPSTTPRTAGGRAWSCGPSRGATRSTRCCGRAGRRACRRGSWCPRRAGGRSPRRWPHELAAEPWLVFACGRYEGIDARVLDEAAAHGRVDEVSPRRLRAQRRRGGGAGRRRGGGPAAARRDRQRRVAGRGVARRGVGGLLEAPGYTKPATWRGREVPDGAAVRRPRPDRPLAPGRVAAPHRRAPAGPARPRSTRPRWTAQDLATAGRAGLGARPRTADWPGSPAPVAD